MGTKSYRLFLQGNIELVHKIKIKTLENLLILEHRYLTQQF